MSQALSLNTLVVKEHVGMFKAANNFDIYDAATGSELMSCREPNLGMFTKILRFTDYKRYTPFELEVRDAQDQLLFSIKRGVSLLRSKVEVLNGSGELLGVFKQKLMSIGGKFLIEDAEENEVCKLQGKWTGWEFTFSKGEDELATVSKKWNGLGKELFTSADNYALEIKETVSPESSERKLILAAVLCIDMVLKE